MLKWEPFQFRVFGLGKPIVESRRADLRTAYPCSLRVIRQVLQGFEVACKSCVGKGFSVPCIAHHCGVLRPG